LIRHGESYSAVEQTIADVAGCKGLTEKGFHQIDLLAKRCAATGEVSDCTTFLSSPIPRARQTAERLLAVLPVDSYREEPDLRDLVPGEADGLSFPAYAERFGRFNLLDEPDRAFAPGGESWTTFTARVRQTLQRLRTEYEGQTVVAACHAGFIVISLIELFAIPRPGTQAYLSPTYTGITELQFAGNRWTLVRYNDTAHLTYSP
jgi:probable phosphoglycerate mutase